MQTSTVGRLESDLPEPVWDLAYLFPAQGGWTEQDYLELDANRPIEYTHGFIEVLPMPTTSHQFILHYLINLLSAFLKEHYPGALAIFASLPVRIGPGRYREPDILVMLAEHLDRVYEQYWDQPDLVMEIVLLGNRDHDLTDKRREYARAGIPEYWIVDPLEESITVLTLPGGETSYRVAGLYRAGDQAQSALLPGFHAPVSEVWKAAQIK